MTNNFQFINIKDENIELNFSTAKNNLNFNIAYNCGISNLKNLKKMFDLEEVAYVKQIHSDYIWRYDGLDHEGDAIITDRANIAIGVFTADCVPILIYDKKKNVMAAIHSGWQGTFKKITYKTICKMVKDYNIHAEELIVYIGPHNRECCYEFGKDIASKFMEDSLYKDVNCFKNGKLNLSKCIIQQILKAGVTFNNIHDLNICTFCSDEFELYSYRKQKDKSGRMFSFIFYKK